MKLTQSTALEEKCFDLSLLPALCNLQLLLVIMKKFTVKYLNSLLHCLLSAILLPINSIGPLQLVVHLINNFHTGKRDIFGEDKKN